MTEFDPVGNLFLASSGGKINRNFEKAGEEFDNRLKRDGSTFMMGNLDLNGQKIINAGSALSDNQVPNFGQLKTAVASIASTIAKGDTGPANSTYSSIAALRAAPTTNLSAIVTATPVGGTFAWTLGDFSSVGDDGSTTIKSNSFPLTTGAWRRISDIVTVKHFGAKGDGSTLDTAAINAAIAFMSARGGGTVFFPYGTYLVNYSPAYDGAGLISIRLRSNVNLKGEGAGSVIKLNNNDAAAGSGALCRLIAATGYLNNITIEDLTIDGNVQNQPKLSPSDPNNNPPANGANILVGGAFVKSVPKGIRINRVRSINAYGQGIQVVGFPGNSAANPVIPAEPGSDITISECSVDTVTYIGIQVSQTKSARIVGNTINNTGDNGIDWYGDDGTNTTTMEHTIVAFNHISNSTVGLFPETNSKCTIFGNHVMDCRIGLVLNRIVGAPFAVDIDSNCFDRIETGVLIVGACFGTRIINNSILNFSVYGIQLGIAGPGEGSFVFYDNNVFAPKDRNQQIVRVPSGVSAANYNTNGFNNRLIEPDQSNPMSPSNYYVSSLGAGIGNVIHTLHSMTNYSAQPDLDPKWLSAGKIDCSGALTTSTLTNSGSAGLTNARVSGIFVHYSNAAPASATAPGEVGEMRADSNFIYHCVAANTWKRAPLSSW